MGNERLFFAEFHLQHPTDKLSQFSLDFHTVLPPPVHRNQKVVRIADILDFLVGMGFCGRRQNLLANFPVFFNKPLALLALSLFDLPLYHFLFTE